MDWAFPADLPAMVQVAIQRSIPRRTQEDITMASANRVTAASIVSSMRWVRRASRRRWARSATRQPSLRSP
jgi:hypothetical protein